jgi:hypothetical protein
MGSPKGCFYVESKKLHGKGSTGKGSQSQPRFSRELVMRRRRLPWLMRPEECIAKAEENNLDCQQPKGGPVMNHERLEWIISGLNRYKLTEREEQFVKSTEVDFNQKNMLTEQQEERLESLYKEKSKLLPNRNYFSPKENVAPEKTKARRYRPKFMP